MSTTFETRGRLSTQRPIRGGSAHQGCDVFILPYGNHTEPLRVRFHSFDAVNRASTLEGERVVVTGTLRAAGVPQGHRVVEVVLVLGHTLVADAVSQTMIETQEFVEYLTAQEMEPGKLDPAALKELLITFVAENPPEVFSGMGRERIEQGLRVALGEDPQFAQEVEQLLAHLRSEGHVKM